ncbi:MAG: acetate kinase [Sulfurospirillum sp.]|nr:acetate kinase [Sulfurospirillum sp.]MBL0703094.1 acetate kinase [Sulfurospirillum sp.]
MKILVLNAGSSSIKFQLFEMNENRSLATGIIEQIGEHDSSGKIEYDGNIIEKKEQIKNHNSGLMLMNMLLIESFTIKSLDELGAIGHRVVHGGEKFTKPAKIDEEVIKEIEQLIPLAPLHNPAHLDGIKVTMEQSPQVPQVAVFDTAFHATIPSYAYMYALPYEAYEKDRVRKYGFHGTSHFYVKKEAEKYLKVENINAITLHLGNGASMAAIKNGKCVDTTMGLTPLEGLIMGTRSGDIDPAILFYLARKNGLDIDNLDNMLNKQSGLKGICGSNDMREIEKMAKKGDKKAQLSLEMFAYRIKKYIGSYSAIVGKLDCIIFTGGIGENSIDTRVRCCADLENLGIELDLVKNNQKIKEILDISLKESKIKVLVIPTNEELEIAIQTNLLLETKIA